MITFKIKKEEDLKKIQAKNIEPIQIIKTAEGWNVEVDEDVNIDEIIRPVKIIPPSATKEETKAEKKARIEKEKKENKNKNKNK